MNFFEFIIRVVVAIAILVFLVVVWAWLPYVNNAHIPDKGEDLVIGFSSFFYGSTLPKGYPAIAILLSRALLGLGLAVWIIIPSFRFFADLDFKPLARNLFIIILGVCIVVYISSIVVHVGYYA